MNVKFLKGVASLGVVALTLTACGSDGADDNSGSAGGGKVTFTAYGGTAQEAYTKAFVEPFAKESGIEVLQDSPTARAKIVEMVGSGNVIWDLVQSGYSIGVEDNALGVLEPIDCNVVPCADFTDGPAKAYKYGMPVQTFSVVLAYNTKSFADNPPTSYADFFDTKKYPGKRAIYTGAPTGALNGILDQALVNDGVARDQLYPLDVDRAIAKLDSIKNDIVFYTDFGQCTDLVASGEAVMGNCYNGRVLNAKTAGQPIDMAWGQQVIYTEYLVIVKGAPNRENAQRLLAYMVSKEHNGRLAGQIAYGPTNPKATVDPSSPFRSALPSEHMLDGDDAPLSVDNAWWAANMDMVGKKWDAFVAK
ncbi:ABC transporter substrate-binding protein [Acrocarpospora catenulata]|uniref:ABC transporter substrate-binding protein n=1 Tax=Acrocarpospora catenulata TaxID=2836182 RepID=UPI001BDAFF48|nr:ABC transporter substrate-binding protein [Acrocarpospora catenulata]